MSGIKAESNHQFIVNMSRNVSRGLINNETGCRHYAVRQDVIFDVVVLRLSHIGLLCPSLYVQTCSVLSSLAIWPISSKPHTEIHTIRKFHRTGR